MVDKAANYTTYKKLAIKINQAMINEDLKYAGYNLLP